MSDLYFSDFLARHHLPMSYTLTAQQWFFPLVRSLALKQIISGNTLIVGISGSQGSGKSTLADFLALTLGELHQIHAVILSIDDFYYTRLQRQILSRTVHPLLATRGVPGTHDVALAINTVRDLSSQGTASIPRFDKTIDDRLPGEKWDRVKTKPNVIILEGWCLGAEPQSEETLLKPVNELEKNEDPDGVWRQHVNQQLRDVYPELFNMIDSWIMLKAPSFDCVFQWRLEQENKLRESLSGASSSTDKLMNEQEIKRFIQHYQRITEQLLKTLPDKVDFLFELNEKRKIIKTRLRTED
ncbi:MAG: kinase [Arenicellales bacterium]